MKRSSSLTTCLLIIFILSACSIPNDTNGTAIPNATSVYDTVSARLTATGAGSSRPLTSTPEPTQLTLTLSPFPLATTVQPTNRNAEDLVPITLSLTPSPSIPCNLAAPGRPKVDITILDGERMSPGQEFSKTWRLLNAGSCTWTTNYAIVWFSGDILAAVREQPFGAAVKPGDSVDITVDMIAPNQPGQHQSNWKLRSASGDLFGIGPTGGAPFWVRIEVITSATVTLPPVINPTQTSTPQTISRGTLDLELGKPVNLDTGKAATGAGDDLELQKSTSADFQLAPVNGARLADFGTQTPSTMDCWNSPLTGEPVRSTALKEGETLCYRTNQGMPGYLHIRTITIKGLKVTIDYLTWAMP
jgi:hypothetical protein